MLRVLSFADESAFSVLAACSTVAKGALRKNEETRGDGS